MNAPLDFSALLKSSVQLNLLMQFVILIVAKKIVGGRPWSHWYLLFGFIFCAHSVYALQQIDFPHVFAQMFLRNGELDQFVVDQVRNQSDFWKFIIPAISLGIGCSMIATFIGTNQPKD